MNQQIHSIMKDASDVESILLNEVNNKNCVYLYLEGDNWCAYERSAYYLTAMKFPVKLDKEIVRDGDDIILMKATFSIKEMHLPLCSSTILRTIADKRLLFQIDKPIGGFSEWKEKQLG